MTQKSKKNIDLADLLRQAISQSGLSVYEIAKQASVSQSNLNQFVNGDREQVTLATASRIFSVLKIRVTLPRNKII